MTMATPETNAPFAYVDEMMQLLDASCISNYADGSGIGQFEKFFKDLCEVDSTQDTAVEVMYSMYESEALARCSRAGESLIADLFIRTVPELFAARQTHCLEFLSHVAQDANPLRSELRNRVDFGVNRTISRAGREGCGPAVIGRLVRLSAEISKR